MQEEVENRTVNLVVSTSRLTVRALMSGIAKFLNRANHRVQIKKDAKYQQKVRRKQEGPRGKQTVRQLVRNSNGLKQLPVQDEHLKEFERVLKKYGVDFAITREAGSAAPRYLVFFKAKDEALLSSVLAECTQRQLDKSKDRKPSVLKRLEKMKAMLKPAQQKIRQKEKDLSL